MSFRRDLRQRNEGEGPQVQAGMRNLQVGKLHHISSVEQDVQVDQPWTKPLAGHAAQPFLYVFAQGEQRLGGEGGSQFQPLRLRNFGWSVTPHGSVS